MATPRTPLVLQRFNRLSALALAILMGFGVPALAADNPASNLTDIVNLAAQNDQTLKAADQNRMAVAENRPIAA
ncbi:MAG: hypothetical protein B7X64_11640 [Halothiobacillus sp. 39-53-45]|nr:MAG: hypothetical protein B7X64_11640 [Halothiobacillus sp. 39-53-45]